MTPDTGKPAASPSNEHSAPRPEGEAKPRWSRPEITSFKPVADAQGISYRIGDGMSNLS